MLQPGAQRCAPGTRDEVLPNAVPRVPLKGSRQHQTELGPGNSLGVLLLTATLRSPQGSSRLRPEAARIAALVGRPDGIRSGRRGPSQAIGRGNTLGTGRIESMTAEKVRQRLRSVFLVPPSSGGPA